MIRDVLRQAHRRFVQAVIPRDAVLVHVDDHHALLKQVTGDLEDEAQQQKRHDDRRALLTRRAAEWFDKVGAGVESILGIRSKFIDAGMDHELVDSHLMQLWSMGVVGISSDDDDEEYSGG